MILADIIRAALRSLAVNRLRTALTMLGIIIGVAAVIAMVALGEGARRNVESSIKSMGTNLLFIRPGPPMRGPVRTGAVDTLKQGDADAIAALPGVAFVSPEISRGQQVKRFTANTNTTVVGAMPDFLSVRAFTVASGNFLAPTDVSGVRRVAVLGSKVATTLFADLDPVGERLQIKGVPFTVIGVLAEKGEQGFSNPDDQIVIPLSTQQKVILGIEYFTSLSVQYQDGVSLNLLIEDIKRVLRERHHIGPNAEDDFNIGSQTEFLATMSQVTGTFTALLGGVAAVSLIVGGIGIMNIMLVSVRERTREIGIRKAIGARRRDILMQFLVEAVVVSVIGGLCGIAGGYLMSFVISTFAGWDTVVPVYAVLLAVLTSGGIGVLFGVWPARVAATLDPVEALRYE